MKKDDPRIHNDKDFIFAPKYDNNITEVLRKRPHGLSDSAIAKMLGMTVAEIRERHTKILNSLKKLFGADNDETIY